MDPYATVAELRAERSRLVARIEDLHARAAGAPLAGDLAAEWNRANSELDEIDKAISQQQRRESRLREIASQPGAAWPATSFGETPDSGAARSRALRTIDKLDIAPEDGDRLTDVVSRDALDAAYVEAVSRPEYASAFGRMLKDPQFGHYEMDREEVEAVRAVRRAEEARALGVGSQGGGYPLPIQVDPSIHLLSTGTLSPLRQLATVRTATSSELRLVASQGATASWDPEFTMVSDDSPILTQPILYPEKAQVFAPFSIEIDADWRALTQELGRVFADAKGNLEADAFISGPGHGSMQPEGLHTGATSVVLTAATAVLAVGDLYSLQESIGPRFQPGASYLSSNAIGNRIYRLTPPGGTAEPPLMSLGRDSILGRPYNEASQMATAVTTGSTIVSYGDFAQAFTIVDRIGFSTELIPHLFGGSAATHYPIGARGLYGYWRVTSGVIAPSAVKHLKVR